MHFDATDQRGPTRVDLADSETQKYVRLSRVFLCKAMECVYINRCPGELSDLTNDEEHWFSIDIQKSESLRQLTSTRHCHGWFRIDIILTDPDTVIERWTMLHLRTGPSDKAFSSAVSKSDVKQEVYRNFAKTLRSIYSMLNVLPTKTLEIALRQVPTATRRITAVCSQFYAKKFVEDGIVCEGGRERYRFGPVVTPIGKCLVVCDSFRRLEFYLPRLGPVWERRPKKEAETEKEMSLPRMSFQSADFSQGTFYESMQPSPLSFSKTEFEGSRRPSAFDLSELVPEGLMSGDYPLDTMDQFCARMAALPSSVPSELRLPVDEVRLVFSDVKAELSEIASNIDKL